MAWSFNGTAGMTDAPLFTAARGRTVAVALRNDTRWPHAIHFHGHHFRVLERDGKPAEQEAWKDTVLIDPQKTYKIAYVDDHTGTWQIHCNTQEPQDSGSTSKSKKALKAKE